MTLLRFMLRSAGRLTLVVALLGLVATASNAGVLAVIHGAVLDEPTPTLMAQFLAAVAGKIAATYASGAVLVRYAQRTISDLRTGMVDKLLTVPFARLQQVGPPRILAALTEDVMRIHGALQATASSLVNATVVLGGIAYLVYLSPRYFLGLFAIGAASAVAHVTFHRRGRRLLERAREQSDKLYALFEQLTGGMKELKLHVGRRQAFVEEGVYTTTTNLRETRVAAQERYLTSQAVTQSLIFGGIFLLLFLTPRTMMSGPFLVGYILGALYLVGPVSGLLRILPVFGMASIALRRIEAIGATLGQPDEEPQVSQGRSSDPSTPPVLSTISLQKACYVHEGFTLGPISATIKPGQITFISGENGSGKSTLALLLCGLYAPSSGAVLLNRVPVDGSTRDRYRQLFSAVFFDFHLAKELWGLSGEATVERAAPWLSRLRLNDKLTIKDGTLSTLDLSQGQRRRAALLVALLEDRPIYLFDEFGADQDPEMRRWFYERLIVDLRDAGKAVVVVTHDDRFFGLADQHLVLAHGRVHRERSHTQGE